MSHVPRVYAFGHGNTSSRTPLIILVFGEFGASEHFPVLLQTERTNLDFDTAIQGIEANQSLIFLREKDETHFLEYGTAGNIAWRHKESTPGIISLAVGKQFEANEVGIISPDQFKS